MTEKTIYKNELQKSAVLAAQKASQALQRLIAPDTRLIVADVEVFEKPQELDAQKLAERCIKYYKQNKVIVSSAIKIYQDDGAKRDGGVMMMFIDQGDIDRLSTLILQRLSTDEERMRLGMQESAITEALNIIGNAYIEVVSGYYQTTIMSMVPAIIDSMVFDDFIGEMVSRATNKTFVIFNTDLLITKSVIEIPFLLAVTLWEEEK
jgi:chemotaxis protein CheY-P-specific phosphatase CheC